MSTAQTASAAPTNARVLDLMRQGDTLAAMQLLRTPSEDEPALLLNQALYHASQGQHPERLWDADTAHRAHLAKSSGAERVKLLFNLGCLALVQDEVTEACAYFQEAVRLDAGHSRAMHNLAYANELLAEYDLALSAYGQALAIAPDQVLSRLNLALLQITMGERHDGLAELRAMAEADPDNAGIVLYLCRSLLSAGEEDDVAEAQAVLERCPDTPRTPELLECRAYAEWRLGHRDQAEGSFRALVVEDPQNAFARLGLMHVLVDRGDYSGLLEHTEVYHQLEPSDRTKRLLDRLNAL